MRQGWDHPSERSLPQVPEKYHTRFHREWTKIWPFIVQISDNPFMFQCTLCLRQISCEHMGKADVEWHISTPMHVSNAKATKSQSTLTFHSVSTPIDEKVNQRLYIYITAYIFLFMLKLKLQHYLSRIMCL